MFNFLSVVSEREVLVVVAADSFSNVESNLSVLFCWLEAFYYELTFDLVARR